MPWKICILTLILLSSILPGMKPAESVEDWYLVQITDPHVQIYDHEADNLSPGSTLSRWSVALRQIAAMDPPPRFAVCTGDLVNFGTGEDGERNLQRALDVLYGSQTAQEYFLDPELTIPLYICPGNHDGKSSNMLPGSLDNYHRIVKEESYYHAVSDDYALFSLNSGLDAFNDIHWILSEGSGLYLEDVQTFLEDLSAVGVHPLHAVGHHET
ncbi:metallophosphoesterase family protein, partial [Candidatus Zixiibacteriota bacterium]